MREIHIYSERRVKVFTLGHRGASTTFPLSSGVLENLTYFSMDLQRPLDLEIINLSNDRCIAMLAKQILFAHVDLNSVSWPGFRLG